jgi:hypothetical protein
MIAPALALLLAAGPAFAYPPEGAMALATTGLVLTPVGALALGGLAIGGGATDPDGPVFGLSSLATVTAGPLLAAGPPLLIAGSLHAQSVLEERGRHVSGAMGWVSLASYVGALAVPELMRTPDGDFGAVSDTTVGWTRGILYAASYAAGVTQYVQVQRVWTPYKAAVKQRALERQIQRRIDEGAADEIDKETNPEPPEPPNPEPPMPWACTWTIAPVALAGGGGAVAVVGTF